MAKKEERKKSLLSVMIDEKVHDEIREYAGEKGLFIKKFVELAAMEYIDRHTQPQGQPDGAE